MNTPLFVQQQSPLIIMPEWEQIISGHIGLENRNFSFSVSLSTQCNYRRDKF